jgi:hypothetical protein
MIPNTMIEKEGEMTTERGIIKVGKDNIFLYSWDAINSCLEERCPAYKLCSYDKTGKCAVQKNYLNSVMNVIFRNYGEDLTESEFMRIGLHLIPLYKILCKLKMEEVMIERVIYYDAKGKININPVFKEIREYIKLIEFTWHSLGLPKMGFEAPNPPVEVENELKINKRKVEDNEQ